MRCRWRQRFAVVCSEAEFAKGQTLMELTAHGRCELGPAAGLVVAPEMAARVVSVEVHEIADLGFAPWCEYQMRHINGSAGISKR